MDLGNKGYWEKAEYAGELGPGSPDIQFYIFITFYLHEERC